ncbi:helix-turn-helix domain-containing protein [Paenibacillus sp. SC116]|uniref:helix-turn-helix domain-containing protein n=1 Tax=Paenibacillus sp. SC116 TaxID=2968986 RepID=UPI00215AE70A|nr:RodZ family helix-turn-helix domain-containing protein [Paenibacillus sp. SC116]MCR8845519.1 helix-turn-helix domain-containing protein [Paenibacillus sp. SC116]
MSELGQMLKEARLEKGLSLDDVQEATKIRRRYLEAIEEGDYNVLPGTFYVRAFVKTYAETVGLNPDEILQYYRNTMPVEEQEQPVEPMIRNKRKVQHSEGFGKWATTLLMWSFVILILVILYIVANQASKGDESKNIDNTNVSEGVQQPAENTGNAENGSGGTTESTPTPEQEPVTEPEQTQEPLVVQESSTSRMNTFVVAAPGEEPLKVEIKGVGGDSWLGVTERDQNGKRLFWNTLENGKSQVIDITEQGVNIRTGRADLIEITVNGQVLDDGDKTSSKTIRVRAVSGEEAKQLQEQADTSNTGAATETP